MFELAGKIALITGGASGIGRSIAEAFTAQGAVVWIGDIDDASAAATAGECGPGCRSVGLDVSSGDSVNAAMTTVIDAAGRLDILVNNAGISHIGTALEADEASWDRVMAVNAKGVFLCAQAAVRQMIAQEPKGGVIINMASIAALIGIVDRFIYSASKGAVLEMTRCLAVDHIKDGIRCNCICPARVHTPFVDDYLARHYPGKEAEMFEKLSEYQPIGRMGKPEEVAALAVYLASDEAAFVTGSAYTIDGGVTAL